MKEIFARTSIREFLDTPVEAQKQELLFKAAMQAPSGGNQQPWEFVAIDDRSILDALGEATPYAAPLKRAPFGIVVLSRSANLKFPDDIASDLSAATQNILLEAVHLGLGAVWIGTAPIAEKMAEVKRILSLPEGIEAYSMIAIGYAATSKEPTQRFDPSRIHRNKY